jgi:uncharacterized protein (TIGR02466 family)
MDKFEFIREHCASDHSGRLLSDHLINVYRLLKEEEQSDAVCDAGLFHSIYGTEVYKHSSVEDRNLICTIIGEEAERLVHLFCTLPMPREESFSKLEDETISSQLISIHEANEKEQGEPIDYEWLFPNIMGIKYLHEDNDAILEYCIKKQEASEGRVISNLGGWQSNDLVYEDWKDVHAMSSLFRNIEGQINQYRIDNGLREDAYCFIDNWWININSGNSTNIIHVHPLSFFSGVYYVKCDPELHPGICFETPLKVKSAMWTSDIEPNENQETNHFTARTWTYAPEVGKLLIFPSWMEHSVGENLTDDLRVSISFNTLAKFIINAG